MCFWCDFEPRNLSAINFFLLLLLLLLLDYYFQTRRISLLLLLFPNQANIKMAAPQQQKMARRDSSPPDGNTPRQQPNSCRPLSSPSSSSTLDQGNGVDDNDIIDNEIEAELPEILTAASTFQLESLRECLNRGASTKTVTTNKSNAAHVMFYEYFELDNYERANVTATVIQMISLLCKRGIDLNSIDKQGQTPLHIISSIPNQAAMIGVLVARGAQIDQQNKAHETALHKAARLMDLANVTALVKAGADVNVTDNDKKTPLHLVAGSKLGSSS